VSNPYEPPLTLALSSDQNDTAKLRFRRFLLASVFVSVATIVVSLLSERTLPAPLRDYLNAQATSNPTSDMVVIAVFGPLIILSIWNIVQLYRFKRYSRPILIVLLVSETLAMLFLGPDIQSPFSAMFSQASTLLWGIVVAMMYCTPYAECFTPKIQENAG